MKILVTGAGGFLGRATVNALLDRGHQVCAMVRSQSATPNWPDMVKIVHADLRVPSQYARALKGVDAVVHLAASVTGGEDEQFNSTVIATEAFLRALIQSGVRRILHVSTIAIYDWHRTSGEMTEASPLSKNIYEMGPYGIAKYWQEKIVEEAAVEHDLDLTILRPGFIWGNGNSDLAGMGRSIGPVHLMFGPFSRLPLTYVENCADCIAATITRKPTDPEIFNVFDSDDIQIWKYCREYYRRKKQRKLLVPIPYTVGFLLAKCAKLTSRVLFGPRGRLPSLLTPIRYEAQFKPLRYSTEKLHQSTGWTPLVGFEDAMTKTFDQLEGPSTG